MTGDDPIMCPHCGCVPPHFDDAGLIALAANLKDACEKMRMHEIAIVILHPPLKDVKGFSEGWQAMLDALELHKKGAT